MILHGKSREVFAADAFEGLVIEIEMSQLKVLFSKRIYIHAEAVVLAGDFDFAGLEILNGVICSAVTEFELVGLSAESQGEKLMAEADAEDRYLSQKLGNAVDCISDGGGVARSVTEKDAIGLSSQNVFGRCAGWDDLNPATV